MVEIVQDNDTGELFARIPGKGYRPVTEEEAAIASQSGPEAFGRSAAAGAKKLGLGALRLTDRAADALGLPANPNADWLAEERAQNQEYLDTQGEMNPAAALGEYAPFVLPFGAPASAGIRGTMAVEGLLGAASTPENALSGFALGAAGGAVGGAAAAGLRALKPSLARGVATGRELFSNTRGAAVDAAEAARPGRMTPGGWLDDMPGEPGSSGVSKPVRGSGDFTETGQQLEGFLSPEELADLGVPLTRGDEAVLRARSKGALEGADARRAAEEVMRSNTFADDLTMKVGKTREGQQEFFTRYLQKELGGEGQGRLTDTAKARLRDDVQSVFKEILDKPEARNIDLAEAATSARDMADAATTNAAKGAEKWAARIESAAGKAEPGATFSDLRSGIGKDMETAFKNGNHELGTTLAAMQESLDDAIAATLSEGEKASLATARRRWRIFKALESATATSEGGNVNLKSFRRAYERVTPAMKRNAGPRDKFERTMETLSFLNEKVAPDSGTAGRIIANTMGGGRGQKMLGGAAALSYLGGD